MAENSKIEWTTHTFNPWRGCTKVSPGCANCYAEQMAGRNPKVLGVWGPNGKRVVAAEDYWRLPLKWHAEAMKARKRERVFCASLADVFEEWNGPVLSAGEKCLSKAPAGNAGPYVETDLRIGRDIVTLGDLRERLLMLAYECHWLDWLFLTKRPQNIEPMLRQARHLHHPREDWWSLQQRATRPNWWFGVSVEDQARADERIPLLLQTPAAVRFLSCEPLLSAVDLSPWLQQQGPGWRYSDDDDSSGWPGIGWVIAGAESGPRARPCNVAWVRSIVKQCCAAAVPCFVKQMGKSPYNLGCQKPNCTDDACRQYMDLKDPKGGDPSEWPEDLRVREFPEVQHA